MRKLSSLIPSTSSSNPPARSHRYPPLPTASETQSLTSASPHPNQPLKSKRSKNSLHDLTARAQARHSLSLPHPPFHAPPDNFAVCSRGTARHDPTGFLTPEPHSTYLTRCSMGGNKKRSFIDGWVESSRRKDARVCAEAINAQTIGGRSWYGDDLWNVRYLKGFAWEDLMAGVRREEREREERVRVGLGREGRERAEFLRGSERGTIEERRREKSKAGGKNGEDETDKLVPEEGE